jgi:hypothetical protein
MIEVFDAPTSSIIQEVVVVILDVNRYKRRAFLYMVLHLAGQDVILGLP